VGIAGEVVFVGAGEVIEMWDPDRYEEYVEQAGDELDDWLIRYL
jgi:DNA-binding transcriptional regulator/RsmH inhibitor MraZ